jgi:hypothetical protein
MSPLEIARLNAVRNFRQRADIVEAEGHGALASLHRATADRIEAGVQDNNAEVLHYLRKQGASA